MRKIQSSFNAGELSPWLDSRVDLDKYGSGCRQLRNFLLTPYGGIRKRPGTNYLGNNGTAKTRLLRFAYSVGTNYVIELSANVMRFWDTSTGALVTAEGGETLAISTPWGESEIFEVRMSQINDVAFIVHPDHAPRKLTRLSANSFTLTEIGFDADNWPPFRDENTSQTTLTASTVGGTAGIKWHYRAVSGAITSTSHITLRDNALAGYTGGTWTHGTASFPALGMNGAEASTQFGYYVEGYINVTETGSHVFYSTADDLVALWIDGVRILNESNTGNAAAEASGTVSLTKGIHRLEMAYVQGGSSKQWSAASSLMWDPPTGSKVAVPSANLFQNVLDSCSLVANVATFEAGHVGAYFMLAHDTDRATLKMTLGSSPAQTPSSDFVALGEWSFETRGIWAGVLKLQRTYDGTNWETIRTWESHKGNSNFTASGVQSRPATFRFQFTDDGAHTSSADPVAILTLSDPRQYSIVRVTAVTDSTNAVADVVRGLYSSGTATAQWFEGAWSDVRGYPRAVTLHEQRAIYAGNEAEPGTIWASSLDDFENFRQGTTDADAWTYSIASPEQNAIQWIASQTQLMIGTSAGEWVMRADDSGTIITPTSVRVNRQSNFGAEYLPAVIAGDAVIFFQRGGRTVREFAYQFERDGWTASNLTLLAEHVTEGGIVQTAWQQQRDGILYVVTGNGKLAALTYERDQAVIGWHIHSTAGEFESVAVVYGDAEEDEVWIVVNRNGTRCIERFEKDGFRRMESGDETLRYLDSYQTASTTPDAGAHKITGLDRFDGETITAIKADGTTKTATVTAGVATFTEALTSVAIGTAYTAEVQPMKLDAQLQDGTAQGRTKRIIRLGLRLRNSRGGEFGADSSRTLDGIPYPEVPFTGEIEVRPDGGYDQNGDIYIRHTTPTPFQILAIIPKFEANGP